MPRSGRIRASTPPLICSTGISWQGCGARGTSCPRAEVPRTGDPSSNPGDPHHYEFNLVSDCLAEHTLPRVALSQSPIGRRLLLIAAVPASSRRFPLRALTGSRCATKSCSKDNPEQECHPDHRHSAVDRTH